MARGRSTRKLKPPTPEEIARIPASFAESRRQAREGLHYEDGTVVFHADGCPCWTGLGPNLEEFHLRIAVPRSHEMFGEAHSARYGRPILLDPRVAARLTRANFGADKIECAAAGPTSGLYGEDGNLEYFSPASGDLSALPYGILRLSGSFPDAIQEKGDLAGAVDWIADLATLVAGRQMSHSRTTVPVSSVADAMNRR